MSYRRNGFTQNRFMNQSIDLFTNRFRSLFTESRSKNWNLFVCDSRSLIPHLIISNLLCSLPVRLGKRVFFFFLLFFKNLGKNVPTLRVTFTLTGGGWSPNLKIKIKDSSCDSFTTLADSRWLEEKIKFILLRLYNFSNYLILKLYITYYQ